MASMYIRAPRLTTKIGVCRVEVFEAIARQQPHIA